MPYKDKKKQSAYQREWVARRRAEWLEKNGPCPCGSRESLQVDHIDPTQKVSHRVWSWSLARRNKELAKCQVLCRPCHQERTNEQQGHKKHGTEWGYAKGCRCAECSLAKADAIRAYRARRKEREKRDPG